jgi:polysaccharide pyruvyl transferase WcaK-like protein
MTEELGVTRALPVVPDLAFGLRPAPPRSPRRPGYDVGISPMVYLRPGSWPIEDQQGYAQLIGLWSRLACTIVARGDRVHFFVSSPSDMQSVNDIMERLPATVRAGCRVVCPDSPNALLEFYGEVDAVVSSRLHGVLLAIVSGRPVLALSHERKVRAVMNDAGVSEFCLDLTGTTSEEVLPILDRLTAELEPCSNRLREYVAEASASLRRQNELIPHLLKARR